MDVVPLESISTLWNGDKAGYTSRLASGHLDTVAMYILR